VHWQCQVIPRADCIEVTGSHIGLIFNRKVYQAVACALAVVVEQVVGRAVGRWRRAD
jgi:hypothetical protein